MTPAAAAALAQRLIAKNGSKVNALRMSAVPTNPAQPWKGAGSPTVAQTLEVDAVCIPHASTVDLGVFGVDEELLKRVSEVYLIPGQGTTDLKTFHAMDVGSVRKVIDWVRELRPAPLDVPAVYAVGVKR